MRSGQSLPGEIHCQPLRVGELSRAVEIHLRTFSPDHVRHTIFSSPKVGDYLATLIAFPEWQTEHEFVGAWEDDELVGYAHCRRVGSAWHLNHIAVLPSHQGNGIGRSLWNSWIAGARQRGCHTLTLDVDETNLVAGHWYRRREMVEIARSWLYHKSYDPDTPSPESSRSVEFLDWPQAVAAHSKFGFSEFRVRYGETVWSVGRLGDAFLRIQHDFPPCLEGVVRTVVPEASLLVVASSALSGDRLRPVSVSIRMQADLPRLDPSL